MVTVIRYAQLVIRQSIYTKGSIKWFMNFKECTFWSDGYLSVSYHETDIA